LLYLIIYGTSIERIFRYERIPGKRLEKQIEI